MDWWFSRGPGGPCKAGVPFGTLFTLEVAENLFPEALEAVCCKCNAGGIVLLHFTVHMYT